MSIAKSTFTSKITNKIRFEQVICILVIFVGLSCIITYVCLFEVKLLRTNEEWANDTLESSLWLVIIGINASIILIIFFGSSVYNTILVVWTTKKWCKISARRRNS